MSTKPEKPYPEFPLFAHASGQWAKKIRGSMKYFGVWSDPDAALARYVDEAPSLRLGKTPIRTDGVSVRYVVNAFLTAKELLVENQELSPRTWKDYETLCKLIVKEFGPQTDVALLTPKDFEDLRSVLAKTRGAVSLTNAVVRVKTILRYAYDMELIDKPVRWGKLFAGASRKARRKERNEKAKRLFKPEELRALINGARPPQQAMFLLGINCGFGNNDIAQLPKSAVDLESGWINFPRPKTAVKRGCPLWPETVAALKVAREYRPQDASDKTSHLFFITERRRPFGHFKADSGGVTDSIGIYTGRLLKRLGISREGLSFYSIRHTFETVGEESLDQAAVSFLMGHAEADDDMAARYREEVNTKRLNRVMDAIRTWLECEKLLPICTTGRKTKKI